MNDVTLNDTGFAFAGSIEAGYPVDLGQGLVLEPQAQLVGQSLSLDDASDGFADVRFDNTASLAGRAGLRLAKTWSNPSTAALPLTMWGRADVWHEFLDAPEVTFASNVGDATFVAGADTTWFAGRVGLSGLAMERLQLQASVGFEVAADGSSTAYDGKIGFVVTW